MILFEFNHVIAVIIVVLLRCWNCCC